jgi:Domain of unknown function (DUF5979)
MMRRRVSRVLLGAFALGVVIFPLAAASADDTGASEEPPPTTAAPAPPTTVAPEPPPVVEPPPTTVAPAPPPTTEVPAPEPTPASEEPVNPAAPPAAVHPAAPGAAPVAPEGVGIVAVVPLKDVHAGVSIDDGLWPHNGPECEGVVLEPGQILWHFVLGPLSGATNAGTTLNSAQWGIVALHPDDTPGGGLQGTNADWIVINTFDTTPTDMTATTDGAVETPNPNDPPGTLQTELRVSHSCGAPLEEVGSLDVVKVVAGSGQPDPGATFTVDVDCDDDAFDTTLVFDADGNLTSGTSPITGIPVGTQCTVTETGDGGADAVTYNPGGANPPTVTIVGNQTVTVTVTNTFNLDQVVGSLDVLKVVTGPGDPDPGATFTIEVDCDDDAFDTTLVFDASGNLTSGTSPITGIPVGTQCTVTETGDGGADGVTYNPGGASPPTVTIVGNQTVTVTVTNNFIETGPGGVDNPPENPGGPGTVPTVVPGNAVPLARTGAETGTLVALAILLVGSGLVVLTIRRRLIGRTG